MDDVILTQVDQTIIYILDDRIGLCLIEYLFEFESILEVALVTEFSDNVAVAIGGEYFEAFEDTGMVEFFKNLYFLEEQFL